MAAELSALTPLLAPKAVAVVGASQRPGRGSQVIANLKACGFAGDIFAVNPRYAEILSCPCVASVRDLPSAVDLVVVAVGADAACGVLEEAHAHGIRAAIVLSAGFGEGGHGEARAARLKALSERGLRICGPNCFGLINVRANFAAFSGPLPGPLRKGSLALVSQSGGLGANVFAPLIADRQIGFSHFVSCGNQIGTTIEDYIEHFAADPDITVIAAVVEDLKNPRKLARVTAAANAKRKSLVLFQAGRSAAGRIAARSHTGALVGDAEVLRAFMRRCGIVQVERYDEFVETVALFAVAPRDEAVGSEVVVISGSGGYAAAAADALDTAAIALAPLHGETKARLAAVLPEFATIGNPIDATGAIYDDPALLPKIFDAVLDGPGRPVIAASVSARLDAGKPSAIMRRFAGICANAARASGRTVVAYQYSPLGGPLDSDLVATLHAADVPLLLGTANAMGALKNLGLRRDCWQRAGDADFGDHLGDLDSGEPLPAGPDAKDWDFPRARAALQASGIPVVEGALADGEDEAVALWRGFGRPVAVKAQARGLVHKNDLGCVRLGCTDEHDVREAYRTVVANARKAGFAASQALVSPMISGTAEVFAGIMDDPRFGPAISFGLGGVLVEVLDDTATEMAPLSLEDARAMIRRIKAYPILAGARGRATVDLESIASLLVALGKFALAHRGRFRALDLNPIIVGPSAALAVDVAVEPI
jgi:acyl-CoA synthetase (NDP forming)